MTDFLFDLIDSELDLIVEKGEIQVDESLRSAVLVSLFTDARCSVAERPIGERSQRGFWGDAIFNEGTGSKLWLLNRAKQNKDTLILSKTYATDALQWMVTDKLASKIEVQTSYDAKDDLQMKVLIQKPDSTSLTLDVSAYWSAVL